jgi:uncharacterized protein
MVTLFRSRLRAFRVADGKYFFGVWRCKGEVGERVIISTGQAVPKNRLFSLSLSHERKNTQRICSNIYVMKARFDWDPNKAASNLRKHGVSFQAAVLVFADPHALVMQNSVENGEERWQAIEVVEGLCMLVVAHSVREQDGIEVIRIISARRANRRERRRYEEENG